MPDSVKLLELKKLTTDVQFDKYNNIPQNDYK
jgi:hypothetical protein